MLTCWDNEETAFENAQHWRKNTVREGGRERGEGREGGGREGGEGEGEREGGGRGGEGRRRIKGRERGVRSFKENSQNQGSV